MNIQTQLKSARKTLGLTIKTAAKLWGFCPRTLQNWELGTNFPNGKALLKIQEIVKGVKLEV